MKVLLANLAPQIKTTNQWIFLIGIQVVLLVVFIFFIRYFCKQLKLKEQGKSTKKTCILISFISAIGWFIIAQIVWVITTIQMTGG
jgi:hypothetical protein